MYLNHRFLLIRAYFDMGLIAFIQKKTSECNDDHTSPAKLQSFEVHHAFFENLTYGLEVAVEIDQPVLVMLNLPRYQRIIPVPVNFRGWEGSMLHAF